MIQACGRFLMLTILATLVLGAVETVDLGDGRSTWRIELAPEAMGLPGVPRFDRTALVRSWTVAGVPVLVRDGLVDEFGLEGDGVQGYDPGAPGVPFLKLAVGVLETGAPAPYQHDIPFAVRRPCRLLPVERRADGVTVGAEDRLGPWAYRYRKSYQADAAARRLVIRYELANTGEAPLPAEHSNHHWFRIGGLVPGPGYRLELPWAPGPPLRPPPWFEDLGGWQRLLPGLQGPRFTKPPPPAQGAGRQAVLAGAGLRLVMAADQALSRYALFASAEAVCPELFVRATIPPGGVWCWSTTYEAIQTE